MGAGKLTRSEELVRAVATRAKWPHAVLSADLDLVAGYPSLAKWRSLLPRLKVRRTKSGPVAIWPRGSQGEVLPLAAGGVLVLGPFGGKNGAPDRSVRALVRGLLGENAALAGALDLKNHTLGTVLQLGKALSVIKTLKELVAAQLVPEIAQLLNADRGSVFLIDQERQELYSVVATGVEWKEIRFPMDRGLSGHVARTGETINVLDAHRDPRFNPEIDRQTGYRTRSVLAAPMRGLQGELIGVVQVINKKDAPAFDREDEELLIAIAAEAANSIMNTRLVEEQRQMLESFITAMATALDARDSLTAGHTARVTEYSLGIGRVLGLGHWQLEHVRIAAMLHDMGKVNTPDAILKKPARLTPEEYDVIKQHAVYTRDIVQSIKLPEELTGLPEESGGHHEWMDGSGYPGGLAGETIPLVARIIAVADVFDAITSQRHYRRAMPLEQALNVIREGVGTHFDPRCVEAFMKYFERDLRSRFEGGAASS